MAKQGTRPKVSVVAVSYNQEKYIRETLESFVTQEADFTFEVIIGDDKSTDRTPEIIAEYARAYPDIIKPILRKKNIGVQQNFIETLRAARGEYIAMCEGDDYWTDTHKLQTQVAFMDKRPDLALSFHSVRVFFEGNEEPESIYPDPDGKHLFTLKELLRRNYIQTNSVMYRRQNYDAMPGDSVNMLPVDWYIHLYHAQFGKIGYIDKVMAAYRRHPGGIWWSSYKNVDDIWKKHGLSHLSLFVELLKLYGKNPEYKKILDGWVHKLLAAVTVVDEKYQTGQLHQILQTYPDTIEQFVRYQWSALEASERALDEAKAQAEETARTLTSKDAAIAERDALLDQTVHELRLIKGSRFWKLRNKIAKVTGRHQV